MYALQSWLKDAVNTFSGVNGSFSAGYALLTASLLAAGIGYIVAPGLTLAGVSSKCVCLEPLEHIEYVAYKSSKCNAAMPTANATAVLAKVAAEQSWAEGWN